MPATHKKKKIVSAFKKKDIDTAALTTAGSGSRTDRRTVAKQIAKAIEAHPCGDAETQCTACCTVKAIDELGKPEGVKCEHVKADADMNPPARGGCTIYKDRPPSCRDYFCGWRYGILGDDVDMRPDKLGLVFDIAGAPPPGVLMVSVREAVPGAIDASMEELQGLIASKGYVFYLVRGDKRHFMGPEELVRRCHDWSKRHLPLVAR